MVQGGFEMMGFSSKVEGRDDGAELFEFPTIEKPKFAAKFFLHF